MLAINAHGFGIDARRDRRKKSIRRIDYPCDDLRRTQSLGEFHYCLWPKTIIESCLVEKLDQGEKLFITQHLARYIIVFLIFEAAGCCLLRQIALVSNFRFLQWVSANSRAAPTVILYDRWSTLKPQGFGVPFQQIAYTRTACLRRTLKPPSSGRAEIIRPHFTNT